MSTRFAATRLALPQLGESGFWVRRHARTLLAWTLFALLFILSTTLSDTFRSPDVVLETFKGTTFVGMAAAAEFFVVVGGGIDLSIGSVATLSGMVAAPSWADATPTSWWRFWPRSESVYPSERSTACW
jgi:ribose/xylose/arabinose/galactoside ABC-type transport system permease subunit